MSTRWSKEEDEYLLANYDYHSASFLSKILERSESAIRSRAAKLKEEELAKEKDFFLSRAGRHKPKRLKKIKGTVEHDNKKKWTGRGNAYQHTKSGYRPDLDLVVRSGWEANVLRVLKSFDIDYEFEPRIFAFPVKRGNKAYIPDVYLPSTNEWVEVKGYLDKNSMVKLKRFKRHYPDEFATLTMIIGASNKTRKFCRELQVPTVLEYPQISKQFKDQIKNWEGR